MIYTGGCAVELPIGLATGFSHPVSAIPVIDAELFILTHQPPFVVDRHRVAGARGQRGRIWAACFNC